MTPKKEPLFRVVRRVGIPFWKKMLLYVAAVVIALAFGALLLMALDVPVAEYYKKVFTMGTIDNKFAYKNIEGLIKLTVPLLITSLALSLAFKMKFWNIGGEGQFIIGAIAASAIALLLGDSMSPWILIPLMSLGGFLAGGLYGVGPAVLKVKFGTNETLMTLMLNYIALYVLYFFAETQGAWNFFLSSASVRPVFQKFAESAQMPLLNIGFDRFRLNLSLVIAVLLYILIFFYLKKTKQGYEISVVGDSINTAKYAGMKVNRIIIRTMFLSASLIGLAGAFYVSSAAGLSAAVTNDVGWTGIIVAWLAKLNPVFIFVTSVLISVLQFGCTNAAADFSAIDSNFADLLQGLILFIILAADFFISFKIVFRKSGKEVK